MQQTKQQLAREAQEHLEHVIIPFWKKLRDDRYGGYYGWLSYELELDKKAVKGCILNSRITWFFSNAYTTLKGIGKTDESLLLEARHGYEFLKEMCMDAVNGGIFWSVNYDGTPADTTKHTYNQAFAIYALSSYFEASDDMEALKMAYDLFCLIEEKCTDEIGYLEAFTIDFRPESNEKLSENGVLADKTMNTLLHVFEAYTEFVRVTQALEDAWAKRARNEVEQRLLGIMDTFATKVYNPKLHRQEVFFDREYNSILDLHSYGHDIETAWLMDRGVAVVGMRDYEEKMTPITMNLTEEIYKTAFDGHSLANECDRGVVNENRVWWVQAEAVIGFLNGYERNPQKTEYLKAAQSIWSFIREHLVDKRAGSEWFWEVHKDGSPIAGRPIVEPWKCPYHNGRLCMELIKRGQEKGEHYDS